MPARIYVLGPRAVTEEVQRALPDMECVAFTDEIDPDVLSSAAGLFVCANIEALPWWKNAQALVPVVGLISKHQDSSVSGELPHAHSTNAVELQLALRAATAECRARALVRELTGPWSHDARGALGVARLALKLAETEGTALASRQKIENGVVRLGWLMERIPHQVALALGLGPVEQPPQGVFPQLEAYIDHLRQVHSRRVIEFAGGLWARQTSSQKFVPFVSGLIEMANKSSSARTTLIIQGDERHVSVQCECLERPPAWVSQASLSSQELTQLGDRVPYRLVEAARLASYTGASLSLLFSERTMLGQVVFKD